MIEVLELYEHPVSGKYIFEINPLTGEKRHYRDEPPPPVTLFEDFHAIRYTVERHKLNHEYTRSGDVVVLLAMTADRGFKGQCHYIYIKKEDWEAAAMSEVTHKGKIVRSWVSPEGMAFGAIRKAPGVDFPTKEEDYEKMSGPVREGKMSEEGVIEYHDEPYRSSRKRFIIND